MKSNNIIIFPASFSFINRNINIFPFSLGNILQTYINQINFLNNYYTRCLLPKNQLPNPDNKINSTNENITSESSTTQEKKKYFKVITNRSDSLFNKADSNSALDKEANLLGNKRYPHRRQRRDNRDNIRKKIKRGFFNNALINKLNDKLKSIRSNKYFMKFPQNFVKDICQKRNKEIINLTLKEIFEKEELYKQENEKGLENYLHNLRVIQSEEIKENEEFKKIFNKSFRKLYEEYVNSNEFKIDEINRLKEKNGDEYVKNYIYLAKHLIEFFSQ
jgi:hypothetical protein